MKRTIPKNKTLKKEVVLALTIAAIPFVFFAYMLAPKSIPVWDLKIFTIKDVFFEDVNLFMWVVSYKILFLTIHTIWFLTCKHWWRQVILFPIAMGIYRFCGFLFLDANGDVEDIFIPMFLISCTLYGIILFKLSKLFDFNTTKNKMSQLNFDIAHIKAELSKFNVKSYKSTKKALIQLMAKKESLTKKEYLTQLIALRDHLTID